MHCYKTVSYTHLDVYKRQQLITTNVNYIYTTKCKWRPTLGRDTYEKVINSHNLLLIPFTKRKSFTSLNVNGAHRMAKESRQ